MLRSGSRESSPSVPPPRWLVRLCALGAGGVSLWLAAQTLTGKIDSVAGCGGAGGCSQALAGRWSVWMGVPVSILAAGFYAGVLLLTSRWLSARWPRAVDFALAAAAVSASLAAAWFTGVLIFVEKTFCPWCATVHALGLLWSAPVLWFRIRGKAAGQPSSRALLTGAAAAGILVAGQWLGPRSETYQLTAAPPAAAAPSAVPAPPPATASTGREISFFNGALKFRTQELPLLGSPDAPRVVVEYFDYTCGSCRDMHKDLKEAKTALGGRVAVIVLPCPLSRECNPSLNPVIKDHAGACGLARLALAVWRAAPGKFPEFHDYLMTLALPADQAAARLRAAECCGGAPSLERALADPWIDARIRQTVREYAVLAAKQPKMPKLLLRENVMMHGITRGPADLTEILKKQLSL